MSTAQLALIAIHQSPGQTPQRLARLIQRPQRTVARVLQHAAQQGVLRRQPGSLYYPATGARSRALVSLVLACADGRGVVCLDAVLAARPGLNRRCAVSAINALASAGVAEVRRSDGRVVGCRIKEASRPAFGPPTVGSPGALTPAAETDVPRPAIGI